MKKMISPLFASTSLRAAIGPMTAAERAAGRYLRAPDGHGEGEGSGGGTGTGSQTPPAIQIAPSVADINTVPEPLRPFYRQVGNEYRLDDPNELRGHLNNLRSERSQLQGRLGQFREIADLGLTVEQIREMHQERQTAEEQRLRSEGDFDTLRTQMETNFNNERTTWQTREQKLTNTISRVLVDDQARTVLADPSIDGNPTLLLPLIRDRVKVTETDDGFVTQVLTPDGAPMLNAQNQPATLKDLFLEMKGKTEFAGAFKGVNQSGSGTPPNGSGGGGAPDASLSRSKMSLAQKTKYIQTHGQDAYWKLPA